MIACVLPSKRVMISGRREKSCLKRNSLSLWMTNDSWRWNGKLMCNIGHRSPFNQLLRNILIDDTRNLVIFLDERCPSYHFPWQWGQESAGESSFAWISIWVSVSKTSEILIFWSLIPINSVVFIPNDGFVAFHYSSYGTFSYKQIDSKRSTAFYPLQKLQELIFVKEVYKSDKRKKSAHHADFF